MEKTAEKQGLVLRAISGEKAALTEIIERNQKGVFALAYRMTGNRDDALDIAQETFVKALENIGGFRGESSLSTWLYSIAANLSRDYLRKSSYHNTVTLVPEWIADTGVSPSAEFERKRRRETVRRAVLELPPAMRAAFVLRYDRGLSMKEIAAALGKSEGTVKSQLHRAVGKIRAIANSGSKNGKTN